MTHDAQLWNDLLYCSGGRLELPKCSFHALCFTFKPDGTPIPGLTLEDSNVIYGDDISRTAKWGDTTDLSQLAGKPVRLKFVMTEADLYSIRFAPED